MYGDFLIIYPKPYSICLRGTIGSLELRVWVQRLGFRVSGSGLGFRVWGSWFKALRFGVQVKIPWAIQSLELVDQTLGL